MRIYILDSAGEIIDRSAEQPPSHWRDAVLESATTRDNFLNLTLREIGEAIHGPVQDADVEILHVYAKWQQGNSYVIEEGKRVPALDFIKRSCIAAWLFNPEILKDFERRSYMFNGYVKILADNVEHGWLLHDGLNRMIL